MAYNIEAQADLAVAITLIHRIQDALGTEEAGESGGAA